MKHTVIASPTYAEIIPAGAEIWGPSRGTGVDEMLTACAPSNADLTAEMLREIRQLTTGVEFVSLRKRGPSIDVGGTRYIRSKMYARTLLNGELLCDERNVERNVDGIRGECFAVARLIGCTIADEIALCQSRWSTAIALRLSSPAMERIEGAWIRVERDDVMVRFRALYFITPVGEETDEETV